MISWGTHERLKISPLQGSSHEPLNYEQPSMGTFFKNAGYHTGIIGKAQPYDADYEPGESTSAFDFRS